MPTTTLLTKDEISNILKELSSQILSTHGEEENLVLIGIKRRGTDLAARLGRILESSMQKSVPRGELDINLYRDDWVKLSAKPQIGPSNIPLNLDGKIVILVDDVLFSGRTVRSALEAIFDYGRPEKVELLTLVDRGHRELPICANYIGLHVDTKKDEHIDVLLDERDGMDAVILH